MPGGAPATASGAASSDTRCSSSHHRYGRRRASSALTSPSRWNGARGRVEHEHAAGADASVLDDVGGVDVDHTDLGRDHDQAVPAAHEAGGAKAVSVEQPHDPHPVAGDHRGGTIPGLGQTAVVVVERADGIVEVGAGIGEGRRDEHCQRMRQRPAGEHQELDDGVELGRIRPALVDDRVQLLQVGAEQPRAQLRLAGGEPVDVAADRVDLAVVRQEVERLGQVPRAERVGRKPAVHECERALVAGIAQVVVVGAQLRCPQEALVDDPLRRQADDRKLGLGHVGGRRRPLDPAPDHVQLALELGLVTGAALDEQLAHDRLGRARELTDPAGLHRRVTPAERALALLGADAHAQLLAAQAQARVARQEHEPGGVGARRRRIVAEGFAEGRAQEPVRQLGHDPGTVARLGIRTGGAAVVEVLERPQGLLDQLVASIAVEPHQRRQAARFVLEPGRRRDPRPGRGASAERSRFDPHSSFG